MKIVFKMEDKQITALFAYNETYKTASLDEIIESLRGMIKEEDKDRVKIFTLFACGEFEHDPFNKHDNFYILTRNVDDIPKEVIDLHTDENSWEFREMRDMLNKEMKKYGKGEENISYSIYQLSGTLK